MITSAVLSVGILALLGGAPDEVAIARIDAALDRATAYLVKCQQPDGAWRSTTYGALREDLSLTPLVLSALHSMPSHGYDLQGVAERAVALLLAPIDGEGRLNPEPALAYPTYTAAMASWSVLPDARTPRRLRARDAWLHYLMRRQCTEALGWTPNDASYGGWGYSPDIPVKQRLDPEAAEANISATLFAVGALRAAGHSTDDPAYTASLIFAGRCQNWPRLAGVPDSVFDDGGFFFSPSAAARNKAGLAGVDAAGRERYSSYGSATTDGLRILIRCGLDFDDPRVVAARRWLEQHFTVRHNPGRFQPDREFLRDAYYYYYCWSVAHALMALGNRNIETAHGPVDWPAALAGELIRRQNADGSWTNPYTDAKEDDPLIATPLAAAALAICRRMMLPDADASSWD